MDTLMKRCPACGTNVFPSEDGVCPACRAVNPIASYVAQPDAAVDFLTPLIADQQGDEIDARRSGPNQGGDDSTLSTGDWIVVVIFPLIGLLVGFVRMALGKRNGGTMMGASAVMLVVVVLMRLALLAVTYSP